MMPDLETIYDKKFFEEWGRNHDRYVRGAAIITDLLARQLRPKRLIDIGAGCGVYSHFFEQRGVASLRLDGVIPPKQERFDGEWIVRDLTEPLQNEWGQFDLALCLEVAEHIPAPFADQFLQNICRFSATLVLSAAPPNQGGHHHVNEQPKRYWVEKLSRLGFAYQRKETGVFVEAFKKAEAPYKWMGEHISVYRKVTDPKNYRSDLPFSVRMTYSLPANL